jgi:hypothetical protein
MYHILMEVLDLLPILIICLHNMINILCHHDLCHLRSLWDFLVGYNQFLLQPIHVVFFKLVLILVCSSTNSKISRLCFVCCNSAASVRARDRTSCTTLNYILYKALVGICIIINCVWDKSFTHDFVHVKCAQCDMKC